MLLKNISHRAYYVWRRDLDVNLVTWQTNFKNSAKSRLLKVQVSETATMEQNKVIPLSTIKSGKKVKLAGIEAGRGLNSRLAAMGLLPNVEITVVNNSHPGPFVISVKGSKIMLGRGMADKIMVSSCDYEKDKGSPDRQS